MIATNWASQMLAACSATVSNTGWTSAGEFEITLQDVGGGGLPLPSRLLRLVEQPHILDGDYCLIGKGLQQAGRDWL